MGFLLAVAAGLMAGECNDLAPWLAVRLVRWAARHRYPERAAARAEELQAVIAYRPSRLLKLATALGFAAATTSTITTRRVRRLLNARHQTMPRISRIAKNGNIILGVIGVGIIASVVGAGVIGIGIGIMRLLAGATYLALLVPIWINGGAQTGLLFIGGVLFLIISLRPIVAGDVITGWSRLRFWLDLRSSRS
jgi:hypothetical protein